MNMLIAKDTHHLYAQMIRFAAAAAGVPVFEEGVQAECLLKLDVIVTSDTGLVRLTKIRNSERLPAYFVLITTRHITPDILIKAWACRISAVKAMPTNPADAKKFVRFLQLLTEV